MVIIWGKGSVDGESSIILKVLPSEASNKDPVFLELRRVFYLAIGLSYE
jgi:hypothetical protein